MLEKASEIVLIYLFDRKWKLDNTRVSGTWAPAGDKNILSYLVSLLGLCSFVLRLSPFVGTLCSLDIDFAVEHHTGTYHYFLVCYPDNLPLI